MENKSSERIGYFDLPLEELYPEDPGELSGVTVTMFDDAGENACLGVYINAHHEIGHLVHPKLRAFLHKGVARVSGDDDVDEGRDTLEALEEGFESPRVNGVLLRFSGIGEETELLAHWCSVHCLGVARGPALRAFLLRALALATDGSQPRSEKGFTESDRELLRAMRIEDH